MNENNTGYKNIKEMAPSSEPERQYYFIKETKKLLKNRFEEYKTSFGTSPKYCVVTFGCQMNARDSEKLSGILKELGFSETEDETEADFVLFNTCTVRENANDRLYGRIGRLKHVKAMNPHMIIGICGCMMQEPDEIEKIKKKYPQIDLIFGTHNLYTFPELIYDLIMKREGESVEIADLGNDVLFSSDYKGRHNSGKRVISVWKDTKDIVEALPNDRKYPFKQGVNIMFGCNNFCSYCIVPYVRGRERSRKPEDILNEVKALAEDGVKEIMLLGQNVNSYGKNLPEPMRFAELLSEVERIKGIERIRFMTSHPKDLSDELIAVMAASHKICRQFHLPLQSGSSSVLKRMNRVYDKERFLERAEALKRAMPDIAISTDIIVGFPGETEEDFLETLDVVEKVRFDSAFTFIYSKREGTPAAKYEDQIPEAVIKDRFDRLLALQNRISEEECKKREGKTLPVLVEELNPHDSKLLTGRLESNGVVHFEGPKELIGKIVNVRLDEAKGFYYMGSLND